MENSFLFLSQWPSGLLGGLILTWQPSITPAAFKNVVSCQPCKPTSYYRQVLSGLWEVDDFVVNGHHLLSKSVDDTVDSGARHPKHPCDHPVWCPTRQSEKEHLCCGTLSMSPILSEKVQQHCQWHSAQPEVLPCVSIIKKNLSRTETAILALQYRGQVWIGIWGKAQVKKNG